MRQQWQVGVCKGSRELRPALSSFMCVSPAFPASLCRLCGTNFNLQPSSCNKCKIRPGGWANACKRMRIYHHLHAQAAFHLSEAEMRAECAHLLVTARIAQTLSTSRISHTPSHSTRFRTPEPREFQLHLTASDLHRTWSGSPSQGRAHLPEQGLVRAWHQVIHVGRDCEEEQAACFCSRP